MPTTVLRNALATAGCAVTLALVSGLLVLTSAQAGHTPVPFPDEPAGLRPPAPMGPTVDEPAGYQGQSSCAAAPLRGTVRLRNLVLATYDRGHDGGTIRSCASGGTSEHKDGRAWDWMLDVGDKRDRATAADFLGWLTAAGRDGTPAVMARRLGVMYLIYNKSIWSSYSGQWRPYSGSSPHTDHIHISLSWNGARGRVSFWTGRTWATDHGTCQVFLDSPSLVAGAKPRTRPCSAATAPARPANRPMVWLGSTGDGVRSAQRLLGVAATGSFTRATRDRVLAYQRGHDLPATGAVDRATWGSVVPREATPNTPGGHPPRQVTGAATGPGPRCCTPVPRAVP